MSTERGGGAEQSRSLKSEGVGGEPGTPLPEGRTTPEEPLTQQRPSGRALLKGREGVVKGETGEGLYTASAASEGGTSPPTLKQPASSTTEASTATKESPKSEGTESFPPRQVIAVSASKGPAAFFNLARKFLVTDEMCDLSALEGAIVSAVDAAHLLERSKLATIVRVQTSYVAVEPKRKKNIAGEIAGSTSEGQEAMDLGEASTATTTATRAAHVGLTSTGATEIISTPAGPVSPSHFPTVPSMEQQAVATIPVEPQGEFSRSRKSHQGRVKGSPLRRARIIITVKRTEEYKQWLEENPLQVAIAGDTEDIEGVPPGAERTYRKPPPRKS